MIKYIHEDLQSLAIKVDDLTPDPKNARKHDAVNIKAIKASLKKFGQRKPIVVQKTAHGLVVRAGNGTLTATKILKRDYIAAVQISEDDEMAKAYAIADNRSAELAEWDDMELASQLLELNEADFDMESLGFSDKELQKLTDSLSEDEAKTKDIKFKSMFEVVIECDSEDEQEEIYNRLREEGLKCRVLSM